MRKHALLISAALATVLSGCNFAPQYRQPVAPVSDAFPNAPSREELTPLATELGWREFFRDPRLQTLIATALERNRDLAQSYARIDQARAQYRIQAADRLPAVGVNGTGTRQRTPMSILGATGQAGGTDLPNGINYSEFNAKVGVTSFELDLWGRVRNLSEAQRQSWLASVEGARAFRISLIAQVAATYFDIRSGEDRIELARRSIDVRREGVRIAKLRLDAGVTSTVDYDQAVLLQTQAESELADLQRTTEQARNLLDVLVGGPVTTTLPSGLGLSDQLLPIAPGLPSDLLINRPDVQQAEHNLRGANANIGAARAAFFPTISLTAAFGFASTGLSNLFTGANQSWNYGGSVDLPIFNWGKREAELKLSKAQAKELTAAYQKTVQTAFREVSDGLVARQHYAEQIEIQQRTVEAQQRLAHAARLRYDNGISIYLEVLDAERSLFSANQTLIQLRATELQNAVSLYAALGGGQEEIAQKPAGEQPEQ
ncbi:multidrug efflux system outer membrane protein [Novosphingobium sp. PhB165]|uniref:efflux transporter outer membrane subunit n=1 Tax=Novosphingobium sp. PhB165 TaxID=2485105 RepID=UPI0010488111|nr:efflux transporter outer membrane subunit [Novosphingobium sp. PhB165]TCM17887.1 multidrug efflux system outer membrane protein [Novosphingobium sp. PhB165]